MKLRKFFTLLFACVAILAPLVFQAEIAQAVGSVLPPVVADFLGFSPSTVLMAVSFTNVSRLARGESNLGGVTKVLIISEDDFTAEWPTRTQVAATGEITVAPPLVSGKSAAKYVFDVKSFSFKNAPANQNLGYQSYQDEFEGMMAGLTDDQNAALELALNTGGVVIAQRPNGQRIVLGTSTKPMVITREFSSGAGATGEAQSKIVGRALDAKDFGVALLASSVTITELA